MSQAEISENTDSAGNVEVGKGKSKNTGKFILIGFIILLVIAAIIILILVLRKKSDGKGNFCCGPSGCTSVGCTGGDQQFGSVDTCNIYCGAVIVCPPGSTCHPGGTGGTGGTGGGPVIPIPPGPPVPPRGVLISGYYTIGYVDNNGIPWYISSTNSTTEGTPVVASSTITAWYYDNKMSQIYDPISGINLGYLNSSGGVCSSSSSSCNLVFSASGVTGAFIMNANGTITTPSGLFLINNGSDPSPSISQCNIFCSNDWSNLCNQTLTLTNNATSVNRLWNINKVSTLVGNVCTVGNNSSCSPDEKCTPVVSSQGVTSNICTIVSSSEPNDCTSIQSGYYSIGARDINGTKWFISTPPINLSSGVTVIINNDVIMSLIPEIWYYDAQRGSIYDTVTNVSLGSTSIPGQTYSVATYNPGALQQQFSIRTDGTISMYSTTCGTITSTSLMYFSGPITTETNYISLYNPICSNYAPPGYNLIIQNGSTPLTSEYYFEISQSSCISNTQCPSARCNANWTCPSAARGSITRYGRNF